MPNATARAALLLTALVSACASGPHSWPNYQYNSENNPVFSGDLKTRWRFDTGGKINGSLAVVDGHVYVDSFSKALFSLNLATGREEWRASLPWIAMSTPVVADGLVIVGTGDNTVSEDGPDRTIWARPEGDDVIALRQRDGEIVWKYHTIGEDMPTPVISDNRVIFGNGDMHAYALDLHSGKPRWIRRIPGVTTMSGATEYRNNVYIVASRGVYYLTSAKQSHMLALSSATGHMTWSSPLGNSDCSPTVARGRVLCEGTLYAAVGDITDGSCGKNDVEAYDASSGKIRWHWIGQPGCFSDFPSSERAIAGFADGDRYFQSIPAESRFSCFSVTSGKTIWSIRTVSPVKMSGVLWRNHVIFGDTSGLISSVNATSGRLERTMTFKDFFSTSAPVIVGKTLLIASGSAVQAIPLSDLFPNM